LKYSKPTKRKLGVVLAIYMPLRMELGFFCVVLSINMMRLRRLDHVDALITASPTIRFNFSSQLKLR
jgi:hypothetical protein